MKETELAEPVISWLQAQNWNVFQEVQFSRMGGVADICAERHGILWIIEAKTAMTIEVLNQASAWPVHFRSIAVPRAKYGFKRDYAVARDYYRVGVIEVSEYDINEKLKPPLYLRHHRTAKRLLSELTELHRTFAKAGSKGGSHLTPYKMTMMQIRSTVERNPGCTIEDLFAEHGAMHYANKSSFKGNVLKCLEDFESQWCRIDKTSKPYKLYLADNAPPSQSFDLGHFIHRGES
jgi:hypothetical protein